LKYATAQPIAKLDNEKITYYFFTTCPGIAAEFVFAAPTISSFDSKTGVVTRRDERVYVDGIVPSTAVAMEFQTRTGKVVRIVLLTQEQAYNSWKVPIDGHEYLLITPADVFVNGRTIHMRSRDVNAFSLSMFPEVGQKLTSNVILQKTGNDGAFVHYKASVNARTVPVTIEQIREAAPSSPVRMGRAFNWRPGPVATAPDDSAFEKAGIWRVTLPKDVLSDLCDVFLDISYIGDVGRLYDGPRLLDDNFFNGTTWEVGLKRFAPDVLTKGVELNILPLRKDAPIYIYQPYRPKFGGDSQTAEVRAVTASPEYEVKMSFSHD
jgi:hypothetical protein